MALVRVACSRRSTSSDETTCEAENQEQADKRIPLLLQTPAVVRWVSAEPLLRPVDLEAVPLASPGAEFYGLRGVAQPLTEKDAEPDDWKYWTRREAKLDWVVVGGESGPGARPFDLSWARSIVQQCKRAGVPVFVKQLGSQPRGICSWPHHDEHPPQWLDRDGCVRAVSTRPDVEFDLAHSVDDAWWPCRPRLKCRKGGEPAEWPADLRVREYPGVEEPE